MNIHQIMTRLYENSRAASTEAEAKEDTMITEVHDGIIVTRPAKRIEYLSEPQKTSEPEIIDLQEYAKSKAGSVSSINKLREIIRFQNSNGRL